MDEKTGFNPNSAAVCLQAMPFQSLSSETESGESVNQGSESGESEQQCSESGESEQRPSLFPATTTKTKPSLFYTGKEDGKLIPES